MLDRIAELIGLQTNFNNAVKIYMGPLYKYSRLKHPTVL